MTANEIDLEQPETWPLDTMSVVKKLRGLEESQRLFEIRLTEVERLIKRCLRKGKMQDETGR